MTLRSDNLRPQIVQHLVRRLEAFQEGFRQNVALISPEGSGKTYQLRQLIVTAPLNVCVLYFPLQRESCRSFVTRLLLHILQVGLNKQGSYSLEELLQEAEGRLPKTLEGAHRALTALKRGLKSEAFNRALDVVPLLTQDINRPCVFIVDEFLCIEETGLGHVFHELGKRVMTWSSVLFILASSSRYRARQIIRERLQLLFGHFELLELDGVNLAVVEPWMQNTLYGFEQEDAVGEFLLHWVGSYPRYLKLITERMLELARLSQTRVLTRRLLFDAIWDLVGADQGVLHVWCQSNIEQLTAVKGHSRAVDVLVEVSRGAKTMTAIAKRLGKAQLANLLQLLTEHDLLERKGGCWLMPDPVFRCWLTAVLSVKRRQSALDETTIKASVDVYLQRLWDQWMLIYRQPFTEQMVTLFSQFDDATIALDSRTGKLPRFRSVQTMDDGSQGSGSYLVADADNRRWCAAVQDGPISEEAISRFDRFCRSQKPKPTRKVLISNAGIDENARTLAKSVNMWVWESSSLNVLQTLYGHK